VDAFGRLSPALQHHIVNSLRWPDLRPVQRLTIDAVLDGHNCVVLAPTAGGKTEAALFPVISRMDLDRLAPVSALYIAPIRALLNNQEPRLSALTGFVGRRAFKWHGDVSASRRRRMLDEPADLLATTPESLEAMLIGTSVPPQRLLSNLRVVVVDEVHAFATDDRGAHLVALLERIQRIAGFDLQRIGLSATIGDPERVVTWLAGSSQRALRVIDPGQRRAEADLTLDHVGSLANAATVIERLHPGTKRLVFADSRRRVEELGRELDRKGVDVHVAHSSLAVSERVAAERAFEQGTNCVIVATSAMELGIDVGDVDHVLQIDAPSTVSSFLQRMGRTGRRSGTMPNCTFLALEDDGVLVGAGLIQLYRQGFVEPAAPANRAFHILAHQALALALQRHGVEVEEWWSWLDGAACFAAVSHAERDALIGHMVRERILSEIDGRLVLGDRGQKLYGGRNFMDLYAVFSTPPLFRVVWGSQEIGTVDAAFVQHRDVDDFAFVLGSKPWRVTHIDWRRGVCAVVPSPEAGLPRWKGQPRFLSWDLCQSMRRILTSDEPDEAWSARARLALRGIRAEHAFLRDVRQPIIEDRDRLTWWTFAGGRANTLLARLMESELGSTVGASNTTVVFRDGAASSKVGIRRAIERFQQAGALDEASLAALAPGSAGGGLHKFEPCLPDAVRALWMVERMFDRKVVGRVIREWGEIPGV